MLVLTRDVMSQDEFTMVFARAQSKLVHNCTFIGTHFQPALCTLSKKFDMNLNNLHTKNLNAIWIPLFQRTFVTIQIIFGFKVHPLELNPIFSCIGKGISIQITNLFLFSSQKIMW